MITRRALNLLVTIGCLLPIALVIVLGVARLLATMQDATGAAVLDRIALGLGVVWGIDLVVLLLALGIKSLETTADQKE
jgi:purine-cytosine permease-like protein